MAQVLVARVTCPNCQQRFDTPIEQVLDVRLDPSAKMRLLNGMVNQAICPHCGMRGALNLPFLYHDPEKQLALVYMPMEAGRDHLERQMAIGKFAQAVMDSLPAEERKAYLLQPQVFLTPETLINKVLEAEGITPEMLEQQKAKAMLLQRFLDAETDEALDELIKAHDAEIDANLLRMVIVNAQIARERRDAQTLQRFTKLYDKLLTLSTEGKAVSARSEIVEVFRQEPTREKLLELLIQTSDRQAREALILLGRPLLDYPFFQSLTARIEATTDPEEQERLKGLRQEILEIRDRIDAEVEAVHMRRAELLRELLASDNPEKLARYHFAELDDAFLNVLRANMEQAAQAGNQEALNALRRIWELIRRLLEEATPPALRLLNRLMMAKDDEEIERVLQANRGLVTQRMVEALQGVEANMREAGETESADHMARVLQKARALLLQVQ